MIQNVSAALFDVEDSFVNSKSKEIERINASQTSPLTNNCEYEIDLAENRYEFCPAVVEKRKKNKHSPSSVSTPKSSVRPTAERICLH